MVLKSTHRQPYLPKRWFGTRHGRPGRAPRPSWPRTAHPGGSSGPGLVAPRVASSTVDFDLSPELADLQQSVRRLAQDKVKPRAREIDATGEYPADIFEAFRQAD